MREFISALRPAALLLLIMTLVSGAVYPALVTGLAQAFFPAQAQGSLVSSQGQVIGSELLGQRFDQPQWFWSRPSATSPQPYDACASGGSNLAPSNPQLARDVAQRLAALRAGDPAAALPVPGDLLTASASGLDPHLSPEAALYQVRRVAQARGLPPERVKALVLAHVEGPQWRVLGQPRVNVLLLNLDLASLARAGEGR